MPARTSRFAPNSRSSSCLWSARASCGYGPDRELIAGDHWEPEIKRQLQKADLILMLISSDYFDSDYIHAVELREAIERHRLGEARVVPVIVRDCAWETDPVVNSLQVLPSDGKPVDDTRLAQPRRRLGRRGARRGPHAPATARGARRR